MAGSSKDHLHRPDCLTDADVVPSGPISRPIFLEEIGDLEEIQIHPAARAIIEEQVMPTEVSPSPDISELFPDLS